MNQPTKPIGRPVDSPSTVTAAAAAAATAVQLAAGGAPAGGVKIPVERKRERRRETAITDKFTMFPTFPLTPNKGCVLALRPHA